MKTKKCSTCEQFKPTSKFRSNRSKKDGLQSKCIPCDKEYARNYYQNNKEKCKTRINRNKLKFKKRYEDLKDGLQCIKCGEDDNICLEFHHLDETKKEYNVAGMIAFGNWNRLISEIEKCKVLCSNCHKKAHKYGLEELMRM